MSKMYPVCFTVLFFAALCSAMPEKTVAQVAADSKLSARLKVTVESLSEADDVKIVVGLSRKSGAAYLPEALLTPRAIARRTKMVKAGTLPSLLTPEDLPFDRADIAALEAQGFRVRYELRQLGQVSGTIEKRKLAALAALPRVTGIDALISRKLDIEKESVLPVTQPTASSAPKGGSGVQSPTSLNYGQSLEQVQQLNVPAVHDLGITGQGVLIASFDAGFDKLSHQAFAQLDTVAAYNFVTRRHFNGSTTGNGSHGTWTLSTVGGYAPGNLIGPAFGAQFLLAETENNNSETPTEEDNWAAAAQWADSLGADIITSSLGYTTFDAPFVDYRWQDMNGRTAISTKAAAHAARVGIVVCNSAGNSYDIADSAGIQRNTLGAPADADSILTAGAVTSEGVRASFSSIGPTADGRIKPDVSARGVAARVAGSSSNAAYTEKSGTSFSCPLTAGVAALVLSAHPSLTPLQVRDALRNTASQAAAPDRYLGWGIMNALAAVNYFGTADTPVEPKPQTFSLAQNYPNPFNPQTVIAYQLASPGNIRLKVFDVLGREVASLVNAAQIAGKYAVSFNAAGLSSGVYFYRLEARSSGSQADGFVETKKMLLVK